MFALVPDDETHLMLAGNAIEFFHLDAEARDARAATAVAEAGPTEHASAIGAPVLGT